jgi:alanine racemase
MSELTWVEISKSALRSNITRLRSLLKPSTILCACVKANAYGHGLCEAGRIFINAGADWLSVHSLPEARRLRVAGLTCPIYILGPVAPDDYSEALQLDCRVVVYNATDLAAIAHAARDTGRPARLHVKIETGTNRQGIRSELLESLCAAIADSPNLMLEGLATHFANIEDTTDHSFAHAQLRRFNEAVELLASRGIRAPILHCANSAATILMPATHFNMVRTGIAAYGMWPSNETYVSFIRERTNGFVLTPALTWKARIAQIKDVPAGEYIGYGCTFKTGHATRLAVIPVGYYDGYDRGIAGGHVLINGQRAPIRGRICMNLFMAEITDISSASVGDEAVLVGRDGDECITAEHIACWASTINYEVTTRINDRLPRRIAD